MKKMLLYKVQLNHYCSNKFIEVVQISPYQILLLILLYHKMNFNQNWKEKKIIIKLK